MDSPHKGSVIRKAFPYHNIIMWFGQITPSIPASHPMHLLVRMWPLGEVSYTRNHSVFCWKLCQETPQDTLSCDLKLCKAQVTLCRSFFADVPDHSRPPRSVMIVAKPWDRGLSSRSLSVQDCQYDISTTAVRHWYDGSVWSTLSTFPTTINTTTNTIDTTARTMLTTTPTLLPICYHD